MSIKKKSIIWFGVLFSLLLGFGISHKALLTIGVKGYLHSQLPRTGKLDFSFDKVQWEEGQLIFHQVSIKGCEGEEGHCFKAEIEDVKVAFDFSLFPFHFSPKVSIDHPQVTLCGDQLSTGKKQKGAYKALDRLFFKTPIRIEDGEFLFGNQVAIVNFDIPNGEQKGLLSVSKKGESPSLNVTFSKEGKSLHFDANFNEFDLDWAFEISRNFLPDLGTDLARCEGKLEGNFSLVLGPPQKVEYIEYNFNLDKAAFFSEKYGLEMCVDHLGWKEHFHSDQEIAGLIAYPLFDQIWPYFIGDSKVTGLRVFFEQPQTKKRWVIADANGTLHFGHLHAPLMEFHGLFHHADKEVPFRLTGEGKVEENALWTLALDTHFFSAEELDASLVLTSLKEGVYQLTATGKGITPDQINLMKHFAEVHVPELNKIEIQQGKFGGKLEGVIENRKLTKFAISNFEATDVVGLVPAEKIHWQGKTIKGNGEIDLSSADFFDGTNWELEVKEGTINWEGKGKIEKIDGHIGMCDQYIKPSTLFCVYDGIEGKAAFEGLYTHLAINIDVLLFTDRLAELLKVKKPADFSESLALDLDMKLKTVDGRMSIDGMLAFLREKGKDDAIEFGWSWNLTNGFNLSAVELGWFRGKEISDRTLNLPLIFWNRSFRGQGTVEVEGSFNGNAIEFTLDPTHLIYTSKAIDMFPQLSEEEKAPSCTFFYDFAEKTWRGKIPLKGVQLKEHAFGLIFESFTTELDLEGTEFHFQNVDAISGGVRFQAEIAVDFSPEDHNELKIDTYAIEGEAQNVLAFLRHFETFKGVHLPLTGVIKSGAGDMHLRAYVGGVEELLEWKIALHLDGGSYPFSETFGFEKLAGELFYSAEDRLFKVQGVEGQLTLSASESPKSYQLNVPLLELDAVNGILNYDCRLEAPTHEICRLVGTGAQEGKWFQLHFDNEQTRLFGAKVVVDALSFGEGRVLEEVNIHTKLSSLDLIHHLDFLTSAGMIPVKSDALHEMRSPHTEGEISLQLYYNRSAESLKFTADSSRLLCGPIDVDHLKVHGERAGDHFELSRFEAGPLMLRVKMDKEANRWEIPFLELIWKKSFLSSGGGNYDDKSKQLNLPIKGIRVDLEDVTPFFNKTEMDWSYLTGILFAQGDLLLDLTEGIKKGMFQADLKVIGEEFGKGKLRLESPQKINLSWSLASGLKLSNASFNFLHPHSNQLWAKTYFDEILYKNREWIGENVKLILPPEMLHFLGQTQSLPYLAYEKDQLLVSDIPVKWDNQVEATFDFAIGENPYAQGYLKEGYYWIGSKAWYLNDFSFSYEKEGLSVNLSTLFDENPFDLSAELSFSPHVTSRITIQGGKGKDFEVPPLIIQSDWNEQEGYFLQSIEGHLAGLDISFHRNPRESFLDKMTLSGQLKIDVPAFAKLLPEQVQETIKTLEIGKGYELSGDLVLHKIDFEESHFTGYLKGKHFELMGSIMETLLSEIDIRLGQIELENFNLSDASGIFSIETIRLLQETDKAWQLIIPEIEITDFRPSLLNKIGQYPGRIKPLTLRKLYAYNVRGILGDASSFKGKGSLNFINTFKRDYNLLDVPFEILGRLGLDMGLLVPVRGDLEFVMNEGRIYLTELKNSYSEGKRSQFFLSPLHSSYIDFEGNINVNIKMKQYVLLKVTEPFILSIGGTFENPKYSLR